MSPVKPCVFLVLILIVTTVVLIETTNARTLDDSIRIIKIRFCTKVYGRLWDYDLKPGSIFSPGEDVYIYGDLMGFSYNPIKLSIQRSIYDPSEVLIELISKLTKIDFI